MSETATIAALCRYPVKGLNPQTLDSVTLTAGETLPFDRAYAIENGPGRFDPAWPAYLPKICFLMLMRNERLAELDTVFDEAGHALTVLHRRREAVRGALLCAEGRAKIEAFLAEFMAQDLKGPPRIVSAPGHSFSDVAAKCLHLVNLASLRELEAVMQTPLDPRRFRANLYFDGAGAWAEKSWTGKTICIGDARLEVFDETTRCAATDVDPISARRFTRIPETLLKTYGHMEFGVYARVVEGGAIQTGDTLTIAKGE